MNVKQATAVTNAIDHLNRIMKNEFAKVYERLDKQQACIDQLIADNKAIKKLIVTNSSAILATIIAALIISLLDL